MDKTHVKLFPNFTSTPFQYTHKPFTYNYNRIPLFGHPYRTDTSLYIKSFVSFPLSCFPNCFWTLFLDNSLPTSYSNEVLLLHFFVTDTEWRRWLSFEYVRHFFLNHFNPLLSVHSSEPDSTRENVHSQTIQLIFKPLLESENIQQLLGEVFVISGVSLSLSLIILFTNVQNKKIYTYIKVQ